MKHITIAEARTRTLIYSLAGTGIILAFVVLILLPNERTLKKMDKDIEELEIQSNDQIILHPALDKILGVNQELRETLEKARFNDPSGLPLPEKAKLPVNEIHKFLSLLQEIAQKTDFQIESVEPDADLNPIPGYLMEHIVLKGDFLNLRNFLFQLNSIPYLEHIETLEVRSIKKFREIQMKIWIATS